MKKYLWLSVRVAVATIFCIQIYRESGPFTTIALALLYVAADFEYMVYFRFDEKLDGIIQKINEDEIKATVKRDMYEAEARENVKAIMHMVRNINSERSPSKSMSNENPQAYEANSVKKQQ